MTRDVVEQLKRAMLDLDMDATLGFVRSIIDGAGGLAAADAVHAVSDTLEVVGKRFQDGEWFVGELVYAGEIAKAAMRLLAPLLGAAATRRLGTVVVGTVAGDLHDLGKNIFVTYARGAGFEVIDLGVDVAAQAFVDAVTRHRPLALGMSCLLTTTAGQVGTVITALERAGVREQVKVIVGGAAITERFAREAGADSFAPDAVTGTDVIKGWCT